MADLDHATLVARAVTWLRKTERCHLVLEDCGSTRERADAIGWKHPAAPSILIEVKANRQDFERDAKKPHRRDPSTGLGCYRWYLAPSGIIRPDELPPLWGLLEPRDELYKPLRRVVPAGAQPAHNRNTELSCVFWQCVRGWSELRQRRSQQQALADERARLTAENARMASELIRLRSELECRPGVANG